MIAISMSSVICIARTARSLADRKITVAQLYYKNTNVSFARRFGIITGSPDGWLKNRSRDADINET